MANRSNWTPEKNRFEKISETDAGKRSRIERAVLLNIDGIEDLAESTGLSYHVVNKYLKEIAYGLALSHELINGNAIDRYFSPELNERKAKKIKRALSLGARSQKDISKITRLNSSIVSQYLDKMGIEMLGRERLILREIEMLKTNKGYLPSNFAEEHELSASTVYAYAKKAGISFSKNPMSARTLKDKLIRRGFSSNELAERFGGTRESIRQYILVTGQYDLWRESREKYCECKKGETLREQKRQRLRNVQLGVGLADAIIRKRLNEMEEDRQAYQDAINFNSKRLPFENVFGVFKKYYDAQRKGEKLSFKEIGRDFGFYASRVKRIINAVGNSSLYWTQRREK